MPFNFEPKYKRKRGPDTVQCFMISIGWNNDPISICGKILAEVSLMQEMFIKNSINLYNTFWIPKQVLNGLKNSRYCPFKKV